MDEILRRFNDKKGCYVNEFGDTKAAVVGVFMSQILQFHIQVKNMEPIVDRKGKGKVDPTDDVAFSCSLQPPSFHLGIEYTQPDDLHFAEIQKHVDVVISNVIIA
ncbi:Hypothetical predicted protein [Olea europaea subsp. europaea]|uniref:Uncharacterized protein n=1 Tax=Olea europaea subsp. europaea TaxID=158383 RepID=A0A8S0UZL3_OLEEU|nr:Hypothetical predicted protein [Olea europaea subsp. europaea]